MGSNVAVGWMRFIAQWFDRGDALDDQVRRTLVRKLYAQPITAAVGTLIAVISTCVAASVSQEVWLYIGCMVLSFIAMSRVWLVFRLPPDDRVSTSKLEHRYAIGAVAYATVLGSFTGLAIVLGTEPGVQALMLVNAIGYSVGVCARNAGRPAIALSQLSLTALPLVLAALWVGTLAYLAMAIIVLLLVGTMWSIVHNLFQTLRSAIGAAETSAHLAERMQVLARTDVVTGLANRAGLNHAMGERMPTLSDVGALALFWLDLDRFKEVNDLLGHPVGDQVLSEVAKRLRESAPAGATIARFGGDEFIVMCPVDDRHACERLASQVLDNVTRPMRIDDERLEVPCSMGIAILPEDAVDLDSLMQAADLALYHAKVGGKNHSRFFEKSMSRNLVRRREIEAELRAAIQRDELSIFFQPIIDLESGRIRTFEALVRWFHPVKGELKPDEFIPVAEETGVIVTLGNWITAQAARAAVHWPEDVTVAVNLSPLQIKAPGAALGILSALREAGLDPSRLELEVTERLFLDDDFATANFINDLSAAGVQFALDDFGTGYSSLGSINKFPFSKIKIDRSFVSGPNVGRKSQAIIRAVAEMGSHLGMEIVAEGIETVDQVGTVKASGCTLGQGYYFSRAVPDYLAAMLLAQERETAGLRAAG